MTRIFKPTIIASLYFLINSTVFGQRLDRPKLAKTIIEALKNSNPDTLLKLTISKADFEYLATDERKNYDTSRINYELKKEQKNI
jgi:hypothetical protein